VKIPIRLTRDQSRFPALPNSLGNCNGTIREPKRIPTYIAQADSESVQDAHPWLRLEQRLLRPKDGSGVRWAQLSSETVVEIAASKA
jgi:hypothetical protein